MVSLGIGLTSDCNLNCAHCYRDHSRIYNLTLADIQKVCASLDPESIGFGTGENGLNPEYFDILEYLHGKNIKLTLASNGYTLGITPDEMLKYFGDVEFSVDFPDQSRQDQFRGSGNWQTVMAGIERCHKLGIRISILAVLMDCNYKDLGSIAKLAASFGSNFRVNTYQPMYTTKYLPSFEQYWQAYQILFDNSEIISVTEPLVNTFLEGGGNLGGTPCGGRSMRVTPDGKLKACVYWPESSLTIDDMVKEKEAIFDKPLFQQTHTVPRFCKNCEHLSNCGGGCASRRKLRFRFDEPDEYCPVYQQKYILLKGQFSPEDKPLRTGSICTTIVRGV